MSATRHRLRVQLLIAVAAFVVYGTTIPFEFDTEAGAVAARVARVSLDPFVDADTGLPMSIPDAVQNILLFIPLGFLAAATFHRVHWTLRLLASVALGVALSAAVEGLQLFTRDRISSVSDVFMNGFGTVIGALAWPVLDLMTGSLLSWSRRRRWVDAPLFYPLMCAVALVITSAWEPFNVTLELGTIWSKVKTVRVDPWLWTGLTDELLHLTRFAIVVGIGTLWASQVGLKKARSWTLLMGVALAVALEGVQFFVESRSPALSDLAFAVAGVFAGLTLAPVVRTWRIASVCALVFAASVLAAVPFYTAPFKVASDYGSFYWFPFRAYYQYTSRQTVSHVFELLLIYFPIGFVIALPRRAWATRRAAFAGLVLAVVLEYTQGWFVSRFADITDIGVAVLSTIAGAWAAKGGFERFSAAAAGDSRTVARPQAMSGAAQAALGTPNQRTLR